MSTIPGNYETSAKTNLGLKINALCARFELSCLQEMKRGIEKESLRVHPETGFLANTPHPRALGASLTHPMLTTDYSEALLEFITPPSTEYDTVLQELYELHAYTYQAIKPEWLWVGSMPCRLPAEADIPIANYGSSPLGRLKSIYREGLGLRYSRAMQTIAGIHYNFSLPDKFWRAYYAFMQPNMPLTQFISEQYLSIIRNGLRLSWILPLLFGASPALCRSFVSHIVELPQGLEPWQEHTLMMPYGTSLRLSDLGYHNTTQALVNVSYNSLPEFLAAIRSAVSTPYAPYTQLGLEKEGRRLQLNDHLLQIEDEFYGLFRPKRSIRPGERLLRVLEQQGVEYIEVRAFDINPFLSVGISEQTLRFLDIFLMLCLLLDSPPLNVAEQSVIRYNHTQMVLWGRDPNLKLKTMETGLEAVSNPLRVLLDCLGVVARFLDLNCNTLAFSETLDQITHLIRNPSLLPSARLLEEMFEKKQSYYQVLRHWAMKHQKDFLSDTLAPTILDKYQDLAQESLQQQAQLEQQAKSESFEIYLERYLRL